MDNFFQQFGTDRLERYWSVVGCSMGVTGLKDGNNMGDLPGIRNSAGDERQIEKSAEDGTNRSSSVFQHMTSDSVNPSSRIFGKLVDEGKNIRARAGKTGKSGTEVVLRDGRIRGVSMVETLSKKLTKCVGYVSGRASTNAIIVDGVRNGCLTRASFTITPKTLTWGFIFEKASKKAVFCILKSIG